MINKKDIQWKYNYELRLKEVLLHLTFFELETWKFFCFLFAKSRFTRFLLYIVTSVELKQSPSSFRVTWLYVNLFILRFFSMGKPVSSRIILPVKSLYLCAITEKAYFYFIEVHFIQKEWNSLKLLSTQILSVKCSPNTRMFTKRRDKN